MRNLTFAIACMTLLAGPALAQTADAPLSTANNAEEGEYLVDPSGMSLYTFKADTRGTDGTAAASACGDDCLGVWPPLIAIERPIGDDDVRAELLDTITRSDGSDRSPITDGLYIIMPKMGRPAISRATTSRASARIGTSLDQMAIALTETTKTAVARATTIDDPWKACF